MADFDLEPGEQELGDWTVNYLPPGGGRYTGKLLVTDKRLLYDAKFDTSVTGTLRDVAFVQFGSHGEMIIDKSAITNVEVSKKVLKKKVIVTLEDGSEHTFDYGMLSIDNMAAAIQQR